MFVRVTGPPWYERSPDPTCGPRFRPLSVPSSRACGTSFPTRRRPEEQLPRFDTPNVLWFFGAIAAASATNALIVAVHPSARGVWILLVALCFAAVYAGLSTALRASRWWVPGGLFATIVVSLVPAVGVGFERLIGVLPTDTTDASFDPFQDFKGSIFALGLATMVVGLIVYAIVRFEFVLAAVALATFLTVQWFLPAVVDHPSGDDHATAFIVTGGVLVLVGLLLDSRARQRAAFWWHVTGLGGIAIGLVYFAGEASDGAWAAMLITGLVVLLLAAPLGRATWAMYGVAGAYAPLVHYIAEGGGRWQIPLVLVFVSLGLVFLGIVVHVYGAAWGSRLRTRYRF